MPTYHIHDTTVKLYVWDPLHPVEDPKTQEPLWPYPSDAARRYDVEPLREEYFEGQEGVDFLGSSTPFFLIKAGRDLFYESRQTSGDITEAEPPEDRGTAERLLVEEDQKCNLPPLLLPTVVKPFTDGADDTDGDSGLSSISSSMFAESSPPRTEDAASQSKSSRRGPKKINKKSRGWGYLPTKPQRKPENTISKPITSAKPIKITVDLSKKSFMKSLYANNSQDISINIFYNGEFVSSKVIRYHTLGSLTPEERSQHFCGRRIDTYLEVPFVVLPATQDGAFTSDQPPEGSDFEDRWNKVNQLLLTEADEWGRTGKYDIFRAPVGEYLEELSKKPVPEDLKNQGTIGNKAGIIDVVIALGNSMSINHWSIHTKPRRKLPEDTCGTEQKLYVVPEELNPRHKARIIAEFEREEIAKAASGSINKRKFPTRNIDGDGYFTTSAVTRKIPLNDSKGKSGSDAAESDGLADLRSLSQDTFQDNTAMQMKEEPSSSQPLALIMPPLRSLRRGSIPTMSPSPSMSGPRQSTRTKPNAMPTTPTTEQSRHPNRPKVTPQKSYKGLSSPAKPQKVENPWEFIPFDAEKSVSHSTRSRRSTAQPVFTPENLRGQELVDSYLTSRNRQLGAPSSTPFDSSDLDSSPCKPSTRANRNYESISGFHEDEDVSMDAGLGMDGAGDLRKRRSDASMASESTPTRSSKRKRPSAGSPEPSLAEGHDSPIPPPKSVKRTKTISKDNQGSNETTLKIDQETHVARMTGVGGAETEEHIEAESTPALYQHEEQAKKKSRRPSRAMLARELSGLLTPHKPTNEVNTSFGASFTESSSTRSTRNLLTKQRKAADDIKVTATYESPMLIIKGVMWQNGSTQNPARKAVNATKSGSIVPPPPQVEKEKNVTKAPETLAETHQLEPVVQPPSSKALKKAEGKEAPQRTVKPQETLERVENAGATSSGPTAAPILSGNRKEANIQNPKETLSKAPRSVSTVAKNGKQSKTNKPKEVLATAATPEQAQGSNIKQDKSKNSTQESAGASMSALTGQAVSAGNNRKAKTEKLPEVRGVSKSESAIETTANTEKTAVSSEQDFTLPQLRTMAPPPTKAVEKIEQPAALLQLSELGSGIKPRRAQNIANTSPGEERQVSGRLALQSTPVKSSWEITMAQGERSMTTKPDIHVQSALPKGKENVNKPAARSSTATKPNLVINPGMSDTRSSRSYNTTSQGMKTPTPRSATFATLKNAETPTTVTRTRSSGITVKDTTWTGGSTAMEGVPTANEQVLQKTTKLPKPARRALLPPLNLGPMSSTTPSGSASTTATVTPTGTLNAKLKEPALPTPSAYADLAWKPNSIFTNSVLTYATAEMAKAWSEKEYISTSGLAKRTTKTERDAVFRANGILMGVRFVLGVGLDEDKEDVVMNG